MSHEAFTATCKWVRPNNGVLQVMFSRPANFSDAASNEEHVLLNVRADRGPYREGERYLIDIRPAKPVG